MPFSFLHAADLHLDTPFTNVGGYPSAVGEALREASLQAWGALVEEASRRQVAFVLLAGDVYDGAERGLRAQRAFLDGVTRLADEGIRTLLVHGNHDPVAEGWTAVRSFPELVTTFPAHTVASERFVAGVEAVTVHGTSYAVAATSDNLARRYPGASGGGFHIGLLHANVGGASTGHADYSPCTLDDLRRPGYQYWALGHVHGRRVLGEGEPWVVYPGNLQGRSTKPTERGPKGAVVVSVTDGVAGEPEFVALDRVRFVDVDVPIAPYAEVGSLLDQLEALASPEAHDGRSLVVRATLTGPGTLHEQLLAPARRAEVHDELRRRRPALAVRLVAVDRLADQGGGGGGRPAPARRLHRRSPAHLRAGRRRAAHRVDRRPARRAAPRARRPAARRRARPDLGGGAGRRPRSHQRSGRMKIDGWHIDGYGVHHDLGATALPDGLTLVTGPNEAGKSTLQDFLVGMLFGFTPSNRADHHAPLRGGTYGGRLLVTDEEGTPFTIHRGSRRSSLRITGPDGPVDDAEAELRRLLGGATKELYLALFAVHTDELDELKALTDDQVRDRVFSAGVLGAGRSAQAALAQLGAERDELWKPGGRSADKYRLRRLREELAAARSAAAEARRQAAGLPGLLHRIAGVEADRDRAHGARSELQDRRSLLFVVSNQWPTWASAAEARGELDQLGVVEPVAPGAGAALAQRLERRDDLLAEADAAAEALAAEQATAEGLAAPGPALAHRGAIGELAAALAVEEAREAAIAQLRAELAGHGAELEATLAAIGPEATEAWLDAHPVDPTDASDLRRAAAAVAQAEQRIAAGRDAHRRARATLDDELAEQDVLEDALAARQAHPVERARTAVEQATALAALLPQRDVLAHRLALAEAPVAPAVAPSTLPAPLAPALVAAAVAAVLGGAGLAATGSALAGGAVAALGLLLAVVATTLRRADAAARAAIVDRPGGAAVDDLRHELAQLDRAIAPLLAALGLDARPAPSPRPPTSARAEQIAAEATQLERDRASAAERRAAPRPAAPGPRPRPPRRAEASRPRRPRGHRLDELARRPRPPGRPSTPPVPPSCSRPSVGPRRSCAPCAPSATCPRRRHRGLGGLRRGRRSARAHQRASTTADPERQPLAVVAELDECKPPGRGGAASPEHPGGGRAAGHRPVRAAPARAEQAQPELDALLAQLGATTLDEAQRRIERAERPRRCGAPSPKPTATCGVFVGPDQDRQDCRQARCSPGPTRSAGSELDDFDRSLRAIDERADDLTTELAHLTRERIDLERSADVATADLRVADLEAQLADAVARWATVVTAHRVVEATLARYQRERQPDVIKRAAAHFARVTDGRYPRLEVRDREVVAIDHAEREVHAHQLSKGATQQLYLCLRFALAESYARTTALPLLLDDVAAHADDGRHPRLAEVVAAVAADHQVLVFTGHDRTVAQLRAACPDAQVIELAPSAPGRRIGLAAG
ncbi:MAG: AAA family ATPase [Acidimicrobiales bacterium]